jgi:arylsulfatase A-like enzyme
MSRLRLWFVIGTLFAGFAPSSALAKAEENPRPNFIFILADDLGYAELGSYGQQKIRTPHLDRLAAEGMRFTAHYSGNAVCAPSRCVLMTGLHPGHAQVRNNREVKPEGQLPLETGTTTLPRLLQHVGYATGAFGKWGLGPVRSTGDPLRQGFDRFYGYNCQRVAHNYYPTYLYDDDERVQLENPEFAAHQKLPEGVDTNAPASYAGYVGSDYAPDLIHAAAREFIRAEHERPFFCYVPTPVPHLAIQVPDDSLAEYAGAFPDDPPYVGDKAYLPHRTPRAAYAAMITRLDREVGRLMDLVDELKLTERTVFVFTSDNGPTYNRLGGSDSDFFASAGGFRGLKGSLYEGGVRVPLIVRWKGTIPPGAVSDRISGFEDWLPTLLELAGAANVVPTDMDGISLAPTLLGRRQKPRPFLYREFPGYGGQQSLRVGDWKLIRQEWITRRGSTDRSRTELYNLAEDPDESHDLAMTNPDRVLQLINLMQRQRVPSRTFPFPRLDGEP